MEHRLRPKRALSQNFLVDRTVANKIVRAANITANDHVIEIGPGMGALTEFIAQSPAVAVTAIDADQRSIEYCMQQPWTRTGITYVHEDVRNVNPNALTMGNAAVLIGNLPYHLSSEILFWVLENRRSFRTAVLMLQREVARRVVACPGTKDYGILSVAFWFGSDARIRFDVKPGSFFPRPKVTSSVLHLRLQHEDRESVPFSEFHTFVRAAFSQRRKVLSNSLRAWANNRQLYLADENVDLARTRAEELHPEQLLHLFQRLKKKPSL